MKQRALPSLTTLGFVMLCAAPPAAAKEPGRGLTAGVQRSLSALCAKVDKLRQCLSSPGALHQGIDHALARWRAGHARGHAYKAQACVVRKAAAAGDLDGALGALRQLEAQGPRGGIGGLIDRYRLSKARSYATQQFTNHAHALIQQGEDPELIKCYWQGLREAGQLDAPSHGLLGRFSAWRNDRRVRGVEHSLARMAGELNRAGQPWLTYSYLSLAGEMKQQHGHRLGHTYRKVRDQAERRAWQELKQLERQPADLDSARSLITLVQAYAEEKGRGLSARQQRAIQRTYLGALSAAALGGRQGLDGREAGQLAAAMITEAKHDGLLSAPTMKEILKSVKARTARGQRVVLSDASTVRTFNRLANEGGERELRPLVEGRRLFGLPLGRATVTLAPAPSRTSAPPESAPNWDAWANKRLAALEEQPQQLAHRHSWERLAERMLPTPGVKLQQAVSLEEAQALLGLAKEQPLGFKNPEYCWLRAHVVAAAIERQGVAVHKVKLSGELYAGDFSWGYHMAPAVMVKRPDGTVQEMILDPHFFKRPATPEEWAQRMKAGPDATLTRLASYKLNERDPATGWERDSLLKALYMGNVSNITAANRTPGPLRESTPTEQTHLTDFFAIGAESAQPRERRTAAPRSSLRTQQTTFADFAGR